MNLHNVQSLLRLLQSRSQKEIKKKKKLILLNIILFLAHYNFYYNFQPVKNYYNFLHISSEYLGEKWLVDKKVKNF